MLSYLIQKCSWIAASVAAAAVNPDDIKTLLANGISTCSIKAKPVFSNSSKSLPKNPRDCPILCNWIFDNFTLAEELFAKVLKSLKTCVLVNNNLCGKLFSSLESRATVDESFKIISVPFFFQILIYWVLNKAILRLKCYTELFCNDIILKQNKL